ncbi:hypothetical protein Y032_0108g15 [Ancylostoma ceylanicum]|nr:hypothetical protein Y032_0108g15 [Ancylostoma ceylanicum]
MVHLLVLVRRNCSAALLLNGNSESPAQRTSAMLLPLILLAVQHGQVQSQGLLGQILGGIQGLGGQGGWGNQGQGQGQGGWGNQGQGQGGWGNQGQGGWGNGGWGGNRQPQQPWGPQNEDNAQNLLGKLVKGVGDMSASIASGIKGNGGEDIVESFRAWAMGPPPPNDVWQRRGRRFCRRFPGHPKCRGGNIPMFSEISHIIDTVIREGGKFLPKVPRLFIRDPLQGINQDLVQAARGFILQLGAISPEAGNLIKNVCRNFKCMEQNKEQIALKETVVKKVFDFEKSVTGKDNTESINLRMDRTMQVKQALLEKANLTNVVTAADNGVFDKDVLLTEKQAHFLLNELGKAGVGSDVPPPGVGGSAKFKRASVFFEENPVQKWDLRTPIPYTFDESLEEYDKNDVRNALKEIEQKTCVRFKYEASPRGYHINYQKVDSPTFCGLSYIGRVDPANPVYLSFQCGNARGVALHETLHALGLNHQHLRMDRDQHITLDWSNINPQHFDYFAVADSKLFTTYGIKYDYGSIMHYNAYTAAVNIAKPTMIPKVNPAQNSGLLGQRNAMSAADVAIVQKMYCIPNCDDKNVYCGAWALKELCNHPNHRGWMINNCRKSCNFCTSG